MSKSKNKKSKDELNKANALVNKYLCNFISNKFLQTFHDQDRNVISQNKYASSCGLSSSTLSKLKSSEGYDIPMTTIYNICRYERYSLKDLFEEFEKKYGVDIPL
ncbi:helix-turn-helix domain-containing protein [Flavivirga algicola]|uniref:Helix-turn-helix domain-containing protein n=1 Tax=Flavivirga algicola TaxID=2729136 RepID=A0ABX1S274_9FLAO|nr:helix-turn-helix domain-containing protein [Flavivirga algicola]NMH89970.1 helix-turn-helix domain-containing protein [Flavivirga algicola]